ncbi:hypothetical protein [Streptomyces africanus]|uniref:hypothetical protein n=1 Tax=Streptomyces africanus TaxID=231024 RepID=UPI000A384F37|nr:hypothetical protein [Streptomyces africanus]
MSGFDIDQALIEQAARLFIKATEELTVSLPHPGGRTVRMTLEVIDGPGLGRVDIDVTNLWALAQYAARRGGTAETIRHATPEPSGKPTLRLVQGEAR